MTGQPVNLNCSKCGIALAIPPEIETFACAACGTQHTVQRSGGVISLKAGGEGVAGVQIGTAPTIGGSAKQCIQLVGSAAKEKTKAAATAIKAANVKMKAATDAIAADHKHIGAIAAVLVTVLLVGLISVISLLVNGHWVAALVVVCFAAFLAYWAYLTALRTSVRFLISDGMRCVKAMIAQWKAKHQQARQANNRSIRVLISEGIRRVKAKIAQWQTTKASAHQSDNMPSYKPDGSAAIQSDNPEEIAPTEIDPADLRAAADAAALAPDEKEAAGSPNEIKEMVLVVQNTKPGVNPAHTLRHALARAFCVVGGWESPITDAKLRIWEL